MIASIGIIFKVCFQKIRKEKDFQDCKHDEQLYQDNQPDLLSPFGHG
jgi:hypothetical protein